ncbi:MAG: glycosyltransferase family 4 protein, partial [Acidimicrobiia bacterium]|nr:glycosyltransferase family 4 protein [Acidimicrobiia bacterium]MDX2466044.1 glycosyltransferase family 4 protein [Acidimicrobiia bacterium]
MRIGLVSTPWVPVPPLSYGGTEEVVDSLARGLVAAGHDVLLFATGDSTCQVPKAWM